MSEAIDKFRRKEQLGIEQDNLYFIMTLMESMNVTAEKAMDLLQLDKAHYLSLWDKLGLNNPWKFAHKEEVLSKQRALELYDGQDWKYFEVGTFHGLGQIHKYLFRDICFSAGEMREVNIAKGNFRFASVLYLRDALWHIDKMPQDTFEYIIEKYVEMNVAHPFREGNGRSMRIWLDLILRKELGKVIDWSQVDKEDYLLAMERSPVRDTEIKALLRKALTNKIDDREVYMKGIDASYRYEGFDTFKIKDL